MKQKNFTSKHFKSWTRSQSLTTATTGTATSVTFSTANGRFGQGGGFNGSTSKIVFGNIHSFASSDAFSFNVWMKTTMSTFGHIIDKQSGATGNKGYLFEIFTGGKFNFGMRTSGGDFLGWQSDTAVNDGEWHMLTITKSTSLTGVTLYLDGKVEGATQGGNGTVSDITNSEQFTIGLRNQDGGSPFSGSIDDVAIFNKELTADEVKSIYIQTAGSFFFNFI